MKQNLSLKTLLLAAALASGLAATARADDSVPGQAAPPAAAASAAGDLSLLGQSYATLTYGYIDLDDTSVHADRYAFEVNQPLAYGLDGVFGYDYAQTGAIAGSRLKQQTLTAGLRAFSAAWSWGKPFVEAGVGYAWNRFAGNDDDSFLWGFGAGVEFLVLPRASVTPYVQYADAPDLASEGTWNFGVRGSYWIDRNWAVTAGFARDDEQNSEFTVGTNFRF